MNITIVRSDRKTIAIQILRDNSVVVRAPKNATDSDIQKFINQKTSWLNRHLSQRQTEPVSQPLTKKELQDLSTQALSTIPPQIAILATKMGVTYGRITIRNQTSRWGSCSSLGNLSFNCLLMLCPPEVINYVLIHELCHRKHMNHSPAFWQEVEHYCPYFETQKSWLKTNGHIIMQKNPKLH